MGNRLRLRRKRGSCSPHSCSGSGEAPVRTGFALAAAIDRDRRLFPSLFVCGAVKISGRWAQRLAKGMTMTNGIIPLIHPCLTICTWEGLWVVVVRSGGGVRAAVLNIKACCFCGTNEKKIRQAGEPHMGNFVDQMACLAFGINW